VLHAEVVTAVVRLEVAVVTLFTGFEHAVAARDRAHAREAVGGAVVIRLDHADAGTTIVPDLRVVTKKVAVVALLVGLFDAVTAVFYARARLPRYGAREVFFELARRRAPVEGGLVAVIALLHPRHLAVATVDQFDAGLARYADIGGILLTLVAATVVRVEVTVVTRLARIFDPVATDDRRLAAACSTDPIWRLGTERRAAVTWVEGAVVALFTLGEHAVAALFGGCTRLPRAS